MKMRNGSNVAFLTGLCVLFVSGVAWYYRQDIHAWYVGYRIIWLDEGLIPESINDLGQAAVYRRFGGRIEAGRSAEGQTSFISLGTLPDGDHGVAINDHGSIIGNDDRAFLWTVEDGLKEIEVGGRTTVPLDLNSKNQVVGYYSRDIPHAYSQAFLWSPDGGMDLGPLFEVRGLALGINEAGWVVGRMTTPAGGRPFLWKPGSAVRDLGTKPGFTCGDATDVNDRGEVLLNMYEDRRSESGTPCLWTEDGGFVDLPMPQGYTNIFGVAINNRGDVLLQAYKPDGDTAGFLVSRGKLKQLPSATENGLTY